MRQLVIGVALAAVACGVTPKETETTGETSAPIISGKASTVDQDSVVLITIGLRGACTGTLVAPNLVLTARHCVTETDGGALCKTDGTPYQGGMLGQNYPASALLIYKGQLASAMADSPSSAAAKGKQVFAETTNTYCDSDVAFILLDRNVSAPIAPIRLASGAKDGESLTAVGWGLTESGKTPTKRLQRSGIKVQAVGPLAWDTGSKIGLAKSEFMIGEGICSGDSGGPTFSTSGAVVGVVSRGGNGDQGGGADSCVGSDTIGIYTHLANKKTLVERAFNASGYQIREEGTAAGLIAGEACTDNLDCGSDACVANVCRTACTTDAECDPEEKCTDQDGLSLCLPEAKPGAPASAGGGDEAAAAAPTDAQNPTKTTTTSCSAAPIGSASTSTGAAFAVCALGVVVTLLRRARRDRRA